MIAAIILAGGKGSRLGGVDKAFVTLADRPLLSHLLERLAPQVDAVAISANGDPARFAAHGLPVLADAALAGYGPLAGIAAGLAWARSLGAAALASLPVDTPFIPRDLIARLAPAPAVAASQGRQHHLVALWPVQALPSLREFLQAPGDPRVRDALALCAARQVLFESLPDPFLNINTPDDLALARSRMGDRPV